MLRCAFYEKEITPPLGCHIPGYFNLRRGSDVLDRLYARAMVADDGSGAVAMISVDGCTVDNSVIPSIKERITALTEIPAERILVTYTHTHTGIPRINGCPDEAALKLQEHYFDVFSLLIADCAVLAHRRLEDCTAEFAKGDVKGISFVRDYYMKSATPTTNPGRLNPDIDGPVTSPDTDLAVIMVRSACGKPMGAVVNFACHPDCVGGTEYSGDYISELALQFKKLYGGDFVTVFLQGTSGDINHFDVSRAEDAPDHYRKMGRIIAGEAEKALAWSTPVADSGIDAKLKTLIVPRTEISDEQIAYARETIARVKKDSGAKIAADNTSRDQYERAMSESLINFIESSPEEYELPLQFIRIGDVKIYCMPSEVFCEFGKMIKRGAKTEKCMVATQCNATFGYIPTRDMFYSTIYESRPGVNHISREAGYLMAEKLLEMGK